MNNSAFILGVTGVIGSGKSTVCRYLVEHKGFVWIEADKVCHELYLPGAAGYKKIADYFGKQFVGPKGVHRGRLRRLVLKTPLKLWILNQLMHPLIAHEVNKKIVQLKREYKGKNELRVCLEAVYFEVKDLGTLIDRLLVIEAPDSVIMKRLKKRKLSAAQIKTLIKIQRRNMPKSPLIIQNGGGKKELFSRLEQAAPAKLSPELL